MGCENRDFRTWVDFCAPIRKICTPSSRMNSLKTFTYALAQTHPVVRAIPLLLR